jgi:hypothetical protein
MPAYYAFPSSSIFHTGDSSVFKYMLSEEKTCNIIGYFKTEGRKRVEFVIGMKELKKNVEDLDLKNKLFPFGLQR